MNYKMQRIAGFGLEAVLRDGEQIEIVDSRTKKIVLVIDGKDEPRVLNQFCRKTNPRAGQRADGKMLNILETLDGYPEIEDYL